ncbi:unnamed protein product [Lactuca saligna]|uniref:Uncharacterized protein n=1 Tax=Lactuca saligna TaxID=75948 RepID=A0AA36DZ41_LACSI|nr:unnamed protein product [Lactuca saligna]
MPIIRKKKSKLPNRENIDHVICAKLPDKELERDLHQIVSNNMIHGPYDNDFPFMPCMKNGKCSKGFPKDFTKDTYIDEDSYPVYRRCDNENNVVKNGVSLDNRYVAPYNKTLLKQYEAHMNLEWCNQLGSIKYDIHYRSSPVERLSFHLKYKQHVFKPSQHVTNVVSKPTIVASQFLAWLECNSYAEKARELSYFEFSTQYVWNKSDKVWTKRKTKTKSLGRINHVSPKSGDLYYLCILLNKVKGPTCYEDIRTVNGTICDSYKDAYYALGLLDDDIEYISSIHETYYWVIASFCRSLFVMLITSDSLSRHHHVFKET